MKSIEEMIDDHIWKQLDDYWDANDREESEEDYLSYLEDKADLDYNERKLETYNH